jgi:predicted P-loop ATPase
MKTESCKISLFETALSDKQTTITLNEYFKGIINGRWQDSVIDYRAGKTDKVKIPAATVSGLFKGRKDADLSEHSGILVIDIDEKDQNIPIAHIREQLKEIPELFAIHYSLGGKGLAVYFRINKAKHYESFEAITKMLINDYNVIPDMHCGNIGRLRFVGYDPDCFLNYGATAWNYFEKKESRVNEHIYDNFIFSDNDIDYIIKQIKERQLDIAPDYYSWIRIGFGLASKLGEEGRQYFRIISGYYTGKKKIDPDKQFDNCLKSDRAKSGGISIKSFFFYAKLAGCTLVSERTAKIKTIAKIRRKQEIAGGSGAPLNAKSDAREFLEKEEGISGADVDQILEQMWVTPVSELKTEESSILHDIEVFLKTNYKLKYNEISNVVEVNGIVLNDYLFNSMYLHASRVVSEKVTKEKVYDLIHSEFVPKYNPILEWFENNKHIKTTGNITKLAACIDSSIKYVDSTFVEYFLEKWLISIIASAHGTYSIICFVLTGEEHGTGKTNFFRELLPEELQWLFVQNKLDAREADVAKIMCSKLLILDDEFGGKSKQDEKKFKELISTQKFSVRMPYGRYFEDLNRLAVLCGTSNDEHVLNDITGNRRIIPISVNKVDEFAFQAIDKKELFVELYWKFRESPRGWFLSKEDIERLNNVAYDSVQVTPEVELPLKYFDKAKAGDLGCKFLSSSEIRSVIEMKSGIRLSQQKLSIALKKIGFNKAYKQIDGYRARGFWVIEKSFSNPLNTETGNIPTPQPTTDDLPF